MHPPLNNQVSPFEYFINTTNKLNLDQKTFFDQFQVVFADGVGKRHYDFFHIASLLRMLNTRDEQLFGIYLESYSKNSSNEIFWSMLVHLSENGDINEFMQKQFSLILTKRMQTVSVETFEKYYRLTTESLKKIKGENSPHFLKIFEDTFHAFLDRQLNDEQFSHRLTESHLKRFLSINAELPSRNSLQHPPYSLIIRHLLFKLNQHITNKVGKIKYLFEKLNNFDQNLRETNDPTNIIRDEWLNDFIFLIPQEWLKMNKDDYQSLCNTHHNNHWSIYIWSRILHLSFVRSEAAKPNEILVPLNEWMNNVKHDVYDAKDDLTIIFIKNIFEMVIASHIKSVLSFSNIDSILKYVLCIREARPNSIDTKLVDVFVENVKQSIKDVLLLNGKIND
jgi:hypothetical protein